MFPTVMNRSPVVAKMDCGPITFLLVQCLLVEDLCSTKPQPLTSKQPRYDCVDTLVKLKLKLCNSNKVKHITIVWHYKLFKGKTWVTVLWNKKVLKIGLGEYSRIGMAIQL